jgi:hypothetical protein
MGKHAPTIRAPANIAVAVVLRMFIVRTPFPAQIFFEPSESTKRKVDAVDETVGFVEIQIVSAEWVGGDG